MSSPNQLCPEAPGSFNDARCSVPAVRVTPNAPVPSRSCSPVAMLRLPVSNGALRSTGLVVLTRVRLTLKFADPVRTSNASRFVSVPLTRARSPFRVRPAAESSLCVQSSGGVSASSSVMSRCSLTMPWLSWIFPPVTPAVSPGPASWADRFSASKPIQLLAMLPG